MDMDIDMVDMCMLVLTVVSERSLYTVPTGPTLQYSVVSTLYPKARIVTYL